MTRKAALVACVTLVLAGCASSGIARRAGDAPGLELAVQSAGPPVTYFLSGEFAGWRPLSTDQVVIWENDKVGYLLRFGQPCEGLQSASEIQLTTGHARVRSGVDSVKFSGGECRIGEIRNLNFQAP